MERLLQTIRSSIGTNTIKLVHANDSKQGVGSHVDRHEHIGQGAIGKAGFRALLAAADLRRVPMVLETPKRSDNDETDDRRNLSMIRRLAQEARHLAL